MAGSNSATWSRRLGFAHDFLDAVDAEVEGGSIGFHLRKERSIRYCNNCRPCLLQLIDCATQSITLFLRDLRRYGQVSDVFVDGLGLTALEIHSLLYLPGMISASGHDRR